MKKFYFAGFKKCRFYIVLFFTFFCLTPGSILLGQTSTPFTTAGGNIWYCPAGVTSITVECWGGGGAGGGATANPSAGGGGAGGAYTKATTIAVTPGVTYNLFVGAGGTGGTGAGSAGQGSWFNTNTTLLAVGGTGGGIGTNGTGATAPTSGNIGGTTNFYAGSGGTGTGTAGSRGGGGGGSAGTANNGNSAVGVTGGVAVTNGGAGANGSTSSADGADASTLGGGGAGAHAGSGTDRNGGNGFTGKVVISYTTPGTYKSSFTSMSIGAANWCAGETRTITVTVKNIGTAPWVDATRQDINIGVKWDGDPDYLVRTDALGLAAGATGTYTFTVTAPATSGVNHLTFDVVYEGVSWFGDNGGGTGPGNAKSISVPLTINALPTAVSVSGGGTVCGSTTLTASNGGSGTMYFEGTTSGGTSTATPSNSQLISTPGTYYFRAQSAGGCWGTEGSATVAINPLPTSVSITGAGAFCGNTTITASNGGSGTIYFEGTTINGTSTATPSTSQLISSSGTYYFRAQSASGCWGTQGTAVMTIGQTPTVSNAGPDQTSAATCGLTTVTLAANAPAVGTGAWSIFSGSGGSFGNTASRTSTFTGISGNSYVLRWTISSNPCTASTDDVTITFNKPPTVSTTSTAVTCFGGNNGTATANPAGGVAPYTYLWSNGQTTQTAINLTANTYSVTVTDSKGCTVSASATVTQASQVVADAGPDQTICSGSTTTLGGLPSATGGSGVYTYAWSPATGLSATNIANPTATPGSTTTYSLVVTDANGCNSAANTATITIGGGTKTWIGGGTSGGGPDNNFNNLRNWSPAGVPAACNDVVMNFDVSSFCCGSTNTVALSNNVTINSLSVTMTGFVFAQGTNIQRLDVGIYSLSILNTTTLTTNASALIVLGPFENEISVGAGGSVTYGGNLTTTSSSSSDLNFPFYATTNNSGKFTVKANATLGGIGNDLGNKPSQVIFDGATGSTQTITQNSGTQAILLGATSTDIGLTNSPKVLLAGSGTGGFQSIGNLNINNTSTLDVGTAQTINRNSAGGTLTLASGAFMRLGAATGGQAGSNFPSNYSTINLNSAATPKSTVEYYGASAQTIFATPLYGNLIVSGASIKTAGGALTIKGDATINTAADVFAGSTFSHSIGGNWFNNVSTAAFTSTGLVTFNGSSAQTIGGTSGSTFNNLTINNAAGVSLLQGQNINSLLTLSLGNLDITNQNLTLGIASPAIAGTFSATRMIVADGGGQVRKNYSANGVYAFPIGDNTGTAEYSPVTLNFTSGTYTAGAYAGVKVTNAKHPANNSTADYLNRYWTVVNNAITSPVYTITSTYLPADVAGAETNIITGKYAGSLPWVAYSPANTASHSLSSVNVTNTGSVDISGISKAPTVTISGGGVTICLGSPVALSTAVTAGSAITYSWTGQGLSSSTTANPTVTPTSAGAQTYTVVVTDQNGLTATFSVIINVSDPVVLVTAPSDIVACPGSDANFSVSATGTALIYQWQVSTDNGVSYTDISGAPYVGFTTNTLTVTAPAFTMSGYLYRVVITPATPCNIIVTSGGKLSFRNLWTGTSSIDWSNGANWSDGNVPSLTCANVTIQAGTPFQPTLSLGTAAINSLIIQPSASLIVSNGTLQIAGTITNGGIFDVSNGAIEFNGPSAQSIPANVFTNNTIKDLIISNDVSLDGLDSLTETLTFGSSNKTFTTNGNLILKSTIAATASVGQILNGNNISGDVTVERYIGTGVGSAPNHGKSWQLLAVPTTGQTIKQAWQEGATTPNGNPVHGYGTMLTSDVAGAASQPTPGFDVYTATGASIKIYNHTTDGYNSPASTQLPIFNKKGYFTFVRGDRSIISAFAAANPTVLRSKGALFTPSNPPPVDTVLAGKFESVANPYASALDIRNINKTGGVDEFFQVWDPRLGGGTNYGAFQTFFKSGSDYLVTPGGGSYGPFGTINNFIQSGQAFMMQATGSDGTVTFTENSKAGGSALFTIANPAPQVQKMLQTALYSVAANGSISVVDGVVNSFDDSYNNSVDGMDAKKSLNTGENLSIKTNGQLLVVERKQTITHQDTIFLNLTGVRAQSYQFQFNAQNIGAGIEGFLEDSYLHTRTPLNLVGNTTVNFTVSNVVASYASDRFRIVFAPQLILPVTFTSVKAYKQNSNVNVEWKVEDEMNIKQYEVEKSANGTQFSTVTVVPASVNGGHSASYIAADTHPSEGYNYYRVKSVDVNGKAAYTGVVKVLLANSRQEITVYPNPITDGVIHLQLTNQPQGKYEVRLVNKAGQVMVSKQVNHSEGSATELIGFDYNMAHGLYQVVIARPNGTQTSINVMY